MRLPDVLGRPAARKHAASRGAAARRQRRFSCAGALPTLIGWVAFWLLIPVAAQGQFSDFSAIPDLNPTQQAIADGTDGFCDGAAGSGTPLNMSLCGGGFRGGVQSGTTDAGTARIGLQQLGYEEVITQGTSAVEVSNTQFANIGARLAALHGGVMSRSLLGVALDRQRTPRVETLVASLLPYAAVASAVPAEPQTFKRFGLFVNGTLTTGDKDATAREAGFDFNTYGVTVGGDYRLTEHVVLGAAFGYANTDADLDASNDRMDTEGLSLSFYGTYYVLTRFYVDAVVGFGWSNYDTTRHVRYAFVDSGGSTRTVDQTMQGDTESTHYSFSFGLGYDFHLGGVTFGPFGRVNYVKVDIEGFREDVALNPGNTETAQNLDIASQNAVSLTTVLGAQASYALSTGFGVLVPQVRVEWEHEFEDDSRRIVATYVEDPGSSFLRIPTDDPDRDFFNVGAGLSAVFAGGMSAYFYYETVLGLDNVAAHHFALGVRKEL
jgi:outer membrane lipase/esterase